MSPAAFDDSGAQAASAGSGSEFAKGWPVLAAALIGTMFSLPVLQSAAIPVLTAELTKVFGWTRTEVQTTSAVMTFATMATVPITGLLINRFGPRRILLICMPLVAMTFMSFALVRTLLEFYALAAAAAIVGTGTLPIAFSRVIIDWFPRRTGTALAIANIGPSLLIVVSVPLAFVVLGAFGWKGVYLVLGAAPLAIWPILFLWFRETSSPAVAATTVPTPAGAEGPSMSEAVRDWRLWVIGVAFFIAAACVVGCFINLPSLLGEAGLTRIQVMTVAPMLGTSAIIGRLAGGPLLDRLWAPALALIFFVLLAAGLMALSIPHLGPLKSAAALALIGFSNGVENDLLAFMVSRYFGSRAYAPIYALLYMFFGVGAGLAPVAFNLGYDLTGSFRLVLYAAAAAIAVAGVGLLTIGRYRYGVVKSAAAVA